MSMLDAALGYARDGFMVFPCLQGGKEPATKRGFHDATTNPETIKRLWRAGDLNIGVATGAGSRFWILDIDGSEGAANLARLQAEHGALPVTRTSITARGYHLLFAYTTPLPSNAGRVAPHIDVRCDGGYAILPPSVHPSGSVYTWRDRGCEIATAPRWLIELARRKSISERAVATARPPSLRHAHDDRYGRAALDAEIAHLRGAMPGWRNAALNLAAFRLYQLVAGGELDPRGLDDLLIGACQTNGLVEDDGIASVRATIRSAARAGLKRPRSRC